MKYRKPISKKSSKKLFKRTVNMVHKKNSVDYVSRGGIRL